jgi:hypothetical protein
MQLRTFALMIACSLVLSAQGNPSRPEASAEKSTRITKQTFKVQLNNGLGTATSKVDDEVTAVVMEPQEYIGWQMIGHIKKLTPAQKGSNKPASLDFQFETLAKDSANTIEVRADVVEVTNSKGVKNVDDEGNIIGGVSNKKKALGGIGGGVFGGVVGYAAGGAAGAAIGAAGGAALGYTLVKMTTKGGQDITFEKGANFALEVNSNGKVVDSNAAARKKS